MYIYIYTLYYSYILYCTRILCMIYAIGWLEKLFTGEFADQGLGYMFNRLLINPD